MLPAETTLFLAATRLLPAETSSFLEATRLLPAGTRLLAGATRLFPVETYSSPTLDEMAAAFGLAQNAFSGRVTNLKDEGYIRPTGARRASRAGCACAVYELTDEGRKYLAHLRSTR